MTKKVAAKKIPDYFGLALEARSEMFKLVRLAAKANSVKALEILRPAIEACNNANLACDSFTCRVRFVRAQASHEIAIAKAEARKNAKLSRAHLKGNK